MIEKKETTQKQKKIFLTRMELWFTPFLIIIPGIVSLIFLLEWYTQGFLPGNTLYTTQGLLGFCILVGNLFFAVPFVKTLLHQNKKKQYKLFI